MVLYTRRPGAKRLTADPENNAGIDLYPLMESAYIFHPETYGKHDVKASENARIEHRKDETVVYIFNPGTILHVTCPYRFRIPAYAFGIIHGRSGNFFKNGIEVFHGVIDPSYRGEIKVGLKFYSTGSFVFRNDIAIAQLVIYGIHWRWELVEISEEEFLRTYSNTSRGEAGFGSTGAVGFGGE